jgi:hypothetical protein
MAKGRTSVPSAVYSRASALLALLMPCQYMLPVSVPKRLKKPSTRCCLSALSYLTSSPPWAWQAACAVLKNPAVATYW